MTEADGTLADGDNRPIFTVGELSQALKARGRGRVRLGQRAGRGLGLQARRVRPSLLRAQGTRMRCSTRSAGAASPADSEFAPEDGLEVVATGKISTYPGRSRYQIVVERLELAGAGALLALLEARKKALAAEGLFDEARRRDLPYLPETVGVVTSPTGAVIRDILHRIEDRFPPPGVGLAGHGAGCRRGGGGRPPPSRASTASTRARRCRSPTC